MSNATGTATLDFGTGGNEASVTVTGQAAIAATSKAEAFVMGDDTSADHTAQDHRYFGALATLSCGTPSAGTGFTIYARSVHNLIGQWTVRWVWAD